MRELNRLGIHELHRRSGGLPNYPEYYEIVRQPTTQRGESKKREEKRGGERKKKERKGRNRER